MNRAAIISINGDAVVGGVERVVASHKAWLERSREVRIISLQQSGWIGALRKRFKVIDRTLLAVFPVVSWLLARIWAGRQGVVFSHGYSSIGIDCDVVFAHGCWAEYAKATNLGIRRFGRLILLYERMAARNARRVISVSDAVESQWIQQYGLDRSKSAVLLNTVDVTLYRPYEPEATVCDKDRLHVIFVGRLELAKGLDYLDSLHASLADADGVSVCLCSPTAPRVEMYERYFRFQILCALDSGALRAEYNKADLFLLPSQYEAFELSSLEALACGTPVLLNDTGSRPTLERLGCPAVFRLEDAPTPLTAIRNAAQRFRGMKRSAVANWTEVHFGSLNSRGHLESLSAHR